MKRILAALLAVLMLVSVFVACDKEPENTDPTPSNGIPKPDENPDDNPDDKNPDDKNPENVTFENVEETVYVSAAVESLNLRTSTDFDSTSNIKTSVEKGTQLKRTGKHETWSRVEYEGETYYCSAKYLTTVVPNPEVTITFTDVNEELYVDTTEYNKAGANYYRFPIQEEEYRVSSLDFGTKVVRNGVYYENPEDPEKLGWSRISIDGVNYYVRNSLLSATDPNATPAA